MSNGENNLRPELQREPAGRAVLTYRVLSKLQNDEQLLRLLYYPPEVIRTDDGKYVSDVLDPALEDIVGSSKYHEVVNNHIIRTAKFDDITDKRTCLIFVHPGRRRPETFVSTLVKQELLIDVLVHNSYQEYDYRMDDICDRIDYLLVGEHVGMGSTELSNPLPMEAPKEYSRFQLRYRYFDNAK